MSDQIEDFSDRILHMLCNAYTYLYHTGKENGHWEDLRGTALAGVALDYKELPNSVWIKLIRGHLETNQIERGESIGSWNEEIWDTAMSIIALKAFEVSSRDSIIKTAIDWISSLYRLNHRDNWHDEPWETSWALIAILTTGVIPENISIEDPIHWILNFQEDDGSIIAPHYTAYYLIIHNLLKKTPVKRESFPIFEEAKNKALLYLKNSLNSCETILWSGEAWANGQILWAISDIDNTFCDSPDKIDKILSWFESNQSKDGNWSDIEDTASSIIGLYKLLNNLTINASTDRNRILRNVLQKRLPTPDVYIKKPLLERHPETGGISIHLNNRIIKIAAILAALAAGVSTLISISEFLRKEFL